MGLARVEIGVSANKVARAIFIIKKTLRRLNKRQSPYFYV